MKNVKWKMENLFLLTRIARPKGPTRMSVLQILQIRDDVIGHHLAHVFH
jgi:hypothetical protein